MRRAIFVTLAAALAVVPPACARQGATEIVVGVSTQMRVPREVTALRVVATGSSGPLACETHPVLGPSPVSAVVRIAGVAGQSVDVVAAAYLGAPPADPCSVEGALVARRARTRFVDKERLYLPMALRHACAGVACDPGLTCVAGECANADVSADGLVEYEASLSADDTSFCFPRAVCFDDVTPAVLVDPADCTFQLPDEVPDNAKNAGRLNIEILHQDLSREVLDFDPVEGFSRVPGRNDRFRLAPALCKRYGARTIAALYIGANCPPKEPLRPLCKAPPGDGGPPPPEQTLCTSPIELAPAKGAVYALVDRSHAMRDAFGATTTFKTAVDLALRAPFLRTMVIGMRLLPAGADACATPANPYASLDGPDAVPFGPPDTARGAIGAILGDPSRVRPDDPPLFLDAAMRDRGAYQALSLLPPELGRRFVVVIGNRDFVGHCSPSLPTPLQEAFLASQSSVASTATLLLAAPPGTNEEGHDPYIDALAIARAGGGPFGDASFDDRSVQKAVAAFVTEAGSCFYDVPAGIDVAGDLTQARVSYFNVLTSARTDITWDPSCKNGFAIERSRVRLCGAACNDLRFAMSTTTDYAIERGFVPVDFPVRWAAPCGR